MCLATIQESVPHHIRPHLPVSHQIQHQHKTVSLFSLLIFKKRALMSTWLDLGYAFNNGTLLLISLLAFLYPNDYKIYFLVSQIQPSHALLSQNILTLFFFCCFHFYAFSFRFSQVISCFEESFIEGVNYKLIRKMLIIWVIDASYWLFYYLTRH